MKSAVELTSSEQKRGFDRPAKALLLVSVVGLLVRLNFVGNPQTPVFDEAYYLNYSLSYCCSHTYYSDLHPPLPKLILGIPGFFSDYKGDYPFAKLSTMPAPRLDAYKLPIRSMRAEAVFFGALVPILLFLLTRALGGSSLIALLAAIWASFENATLVHSSFVLLDQFLLCGIFGTILCYVYAKQASRKATTIGWSIAAGACLALAVGTKLTGLSAAGAIGIDLFVTTAVAKTRGASTKALRMSLWGLATFFAIYIGSWAIHELLLAPDQNWSLKQPMLFEITDRIIYNHMDLIHGHLSLGPEDKFGSRWWQWLFGYRPLRFWQSAGRTIYFFPNLFLWISIVASVPLSAAIFVLSKISNVSIKADRHAFQEIRVLLLFIAFSFVPNIFISRVLYLYQFLPTLHGSIVFSALYVQYIGLVPRPEFFTNVSALKQRVVLATLIALPILGFIVGLPLSHGVAGKYSTALKAQVDKLEHWR